VHFPFFIVKIFYAELSLRALPSKGLAREVKVFPEGMGALER
jgi:hypothetical protein